jgi:hypothetical protein
MTTAMAISSHRPLVQMGILSNQPFPVLRRSSAPILIPTMMRIATNATTMTGSIHEGSLI